VEKARGFLEHRPVFIENPAPLSGRGDKQGALTCSSRDAAAVPASNSAPSIVPTPPSITSGTPAALRLAWPSLRAGGRPSSVRLATADTSTASQAARSCALAEATVAALAAPTTTDTVAPQEDMPPHTPQLSTVLAQQMPVGGRGVRQHTPIWQGRGHGVAECVIDRIQLWATMWSVRTALQ
jgi:hypothetical protein